MEVLCYKGLELRKTSIDILGCLENTDLENGVMTAFGCVFEVCVFEVSVFEVCVFEVCVFEVCGLRSAFSRSVFSRHPDILA